MAVSRLCPDRVSAGVVMSARHHFVKELTLAAANVAWTNKIIAAQRRRVARVKCKGGDNGDAEDLLEMM